jgi:hypothetical protein
MQMQRRWVVCLSTCWHRATVATAGTVLPCHHSRAKPVPFITPFTTPFTTPSITLFITPFTSFTTPMPMHAATTAAWLRRLALLEQCSTLAPVALAGLTFGGPCAERLDFVAAEQLVKHAHACTDGLIRSLIGSPAALPAAAVASGALQRMLARAIASLAPAAPASQQLASGLLGQVAEFASKDLSFHSVS